MELGNMAFGHSRGEHPIDDRMGYLDDFMPLLDAICEGSIYGTNFENESFEMHPYCWCDEETCKQCGTGEQCNFVHKPSGLAVRWYKYAFRDSYMSKSVDRAGFREIVAECVASLEPNKQQRARP
jgi:hypothetical protein